MSNHYERTTVPNFDEEMSESGVEKCDLVAPEGDEEVNDPLAVRVGLWAQDIPGEVFSDTFYPETARKIFELLPDKELDL